MCEEEAREAKREATGRGKEEKEQLRKDDKMKQRK